MKQQKKAFIFVLVLLISLLVQVCPAKASGDIEINSENFPDNNFRAHVRRFDKNENDVLETYELDAVLSISCENKSIVSLEGIRHFGNLETLHCENNQIQFLDVSGLEWLETLYCYSNCSC